MPKHFRMVHKCLHHVWMCHPLYLLHRSIRALPLPSLRRLGHDSHFGCSSRNPFSWPAWPAESRTAKNPSPLQSDGSHDDTAVLLRRRRAARRGLGAGQLRTIVGRALLGWENAVEIWRDLNHREFASAGCSRGLGPQYNCLESVMMRL